MKSFGHVASAFWMRGSGKRLRGDLAAQTIGLYLVSAPTASAIGVYYLPLATIANDTGCTIEVVRSALARIEAAEFAYYDENAELVWVPNLPLFDMGESLKPGDRRAIRIRSDVKALGDHRFVRLFWRTYGEKYLLGDYPFTEKLQCERFSDAPFETQNKTRNPLEGRGGEEEDLSYGESLRGGDDERPPGQDRPQLPQFATRVDIMEPKILVDVSVTPDVFAAYVGAYTTVTGHKPAIAYERSFQRELMRICATKSGGLSGGQLVDWTRENATKAANVGAEASVFAFARFLNTVEASHPKDASESIYGAAIAKGRGSPYSCPSGAEPVLRKVFAEHGFKRDGSRASPDQFAAWLASEAEGFAEWLTRRIKREPDARRWYSDYAPKGFQKYLNDLALDEAAERENAPILGAAQ